MIIGKLGRGRGGRHTWIELKLFEGRNIEKTAPFEVREISFELFAGSTVNQYKSQNALETEHDHVTDCTT